MGNSPNNTNDIQPQKPPQEEITKITSCENLFGKKKAPPSIMNSSLEIDKNIKLPTKYQDTSKDLCAILRKLYDYQENDSIQPSINLHCDLKCIEKSIFGNLSPEEKEFTVRYYISSQLPKYYLVGLYAKLIMQVGTNHSGVQVCDKLIHWFDNSLVAVSDFSGEKALAIIPPYKDDDECLTVPNTPEMRLKICKLIQKWNCTITYSSMINNCQKFSSQLFKKMGLNNDFTEGPLKEFIDFISRANNTQTKPCYVVNGEIKKSWENHYELDEWTIQNKPFIGRKYQALIKGFQKENQTRYFANKKKKKKDWKYWKKFLFSSKKGEFL
eukprot:TRINITY_DN2522_c0_g2_i1.p1 TRINITY_DN2522_c0_g2~~TRINITY_DN2522_c0_g2_i1.p1  ORF type:complete len:327 (+),score=83.16 TRINITY_DN2522_c0_g2_i1:731-1711(+)